MNFVLNESPNLCLLYCHFHISKMEKVLPEKVKVMPIGTNNCFVS